MKGLTRSSLVLISIAVWLGGCASLAPLPGRSGIADEIAASNGFDKSFINTDNFTLTAYSRLKEKGKPLTIYIEGDGRAWISRTRISPDPTPQNLLVLELALLDPSPNIAYLARPGQYLSADTPQYDPEYWSDKRFSEEVVNSMNQAIEKLREKSQAKEVNLIGYSGGGAIAVLVAARRNDVASLRTVAGNLDHQAVNRQQRVSPLAGSLNPIDYAQDVRKIPQRHFTGSDDKICPPFIARLFAQRMNDESYSTVTVVNGATHDKGWDKHWKELLGLPLNTLY